MDYKKLITETFNNYQGPNVEILDQLYDKDVVFEDPLTKVAGLPELKKYYQHAYKPVTSIRFDFKTIHDAFPVYTCEWDMFFAAKTLNSGKPFSVRGVSVITFSEESQKVIRHHDYVDIGAMVYEKVPGLGTLVRFLKSRLSH